MVTNIILVAISMVLTVGISAHNFNAIASSGKINLTIFIIIVSSSYGGFWHFIFLVIKSINITIRTVFMVINCQ